VGVHITENVNDSYLGSGARLRRAIKKYGRENFSKEILHEFENSKDMYRKEAEIVNEDFIKRKDVYNMHVGGIGAPKGNRYGVSSYRQPENEFSLKKRGFSRKGAKHTEDAKKRIALAKIGNQHARKNK